MLTSLVTGAATIALLKPAVTGREICSEPQGLYVFVEWGISVLEGIRASFNEDRWPESLEWQRCLEIPLQSKMLEYTQAQR